MTTCVDIVDLIKPDYNESLNKIHESGIYTQLDEYLFLRIFFLIIKRFLIRHILFLLQ